MKPTWLTTGFASLYRQDYLRQHSVRQDRSCPQGCRQRGRGSRRGWCQNQALHRWYETPTKPTLLCDWYLTGRIELELDEEGTRISLTIVDTPGFGDQVDNEARCDIAAPQTLHLCFGADFRLPVSLKLSASSRGNTTTFWPRSRVSSVTLGSGTTVFMPCSTSSHPPATGTYSVPTECHQVPLTYDTVSASWISS